MFLALPWSLGLLLTSAAGAQERAGRRQGFTEQGGEAIYKNVCQGCHMPDAKGAVGAGMYPALAKDPKLEVAGYPVAVVVNGQKAMPAFGGMMTRPADRRCDQLCAHALRQQL